jgi:NADPH:quinone reductase-like Zn-dependent oxidoreductase
MRAVQLTAFGNPLDVLELANIAEPPEPGANEVLVGVELSPVNPNDLSLARGTYALRPALPTVIGNEGVGRILSVGPGVKTVKTGDRVLLPLSSFTWRERMVIPAQGLFALPAGADPQQLAMLGINPPTAALLLSEFVSLKPGDWVIQNAANSGVGRWVIAFAQARGLKTLNIVRRTELVDEIKALGADASRVCGQDPGCYQTGDWHDCGRTGAHSSGSHLSARCDQGCGGARSTGRQGSASGCRVSHSAGSPVMF